MSDMPNGLPTPTPTPTLFPFNILRQQQHQQYFPSISYHTDNDISDIGNDISDF
jgi:hypothetical protein